MTKAEEIFNIISINIDGAIKSRMFGALCLKAVNNGKAFVMLWKGYMIFKLTGDDLQNALSLDGAKIFEPAEGRPMGGWVQLDDAYINEWESLALQAYNYVKVLSK